MSSEGAKPEHLSGAISFKNIKFAYPSRPNLYIYGGPQAPEGFNLEIKAGETVAMVSFHTDVQYLLNIHTYVFLACSHMRCVYSLV
jgi:alpha-ketoglutarate-dependent taurine dioxygenase